MSQEIGRLVTGNVVAGGAVVGMKVDPEVYVPEKYIPWFERVQSFYGIDFTGNDITSAVSLLVAVLIVINTTVTLYRRRQDKKRFNELN